MNTTEPSDYASIKALFLELHEAGATERDARLAALDRDRPDSAQAVRRLLAAAGTPLPSLDQTAREPAAIEFPRYRCLHELGRGGMGRVWLAERSDGAFVQRYALKQLDRERWSDAERERFVRERQILAELDHRNIASLVDGGSDSRGAPFLVTAYIDGERIDDYCETHGLDLHARVALVRDLADAIAYAHRRLVVHRDIKPANVLVDSDGTAKLLDFGIAKLLGEHGSTTADGASLMTLRYAAPEQVRGERVGVGCDIYALGVLLYELVSGVSPYAQVEGAAAITQAILQHEPSPPSRVAAARGRSGDRDLDAICAKALRKRPEDRYASADALRDDLDRYLAREPVQARRGERGYRLRRGLRRYWAVLLTAGAALAFAGYHVYRLDAQLAQTQRERDRAREVGRLFADMFAKLPPAEVRDGEISAKRLLELTAHDLLARPRTTADREHLDGLLLSAVAESQEALGLNEDAEKLFAEAVQRLRAAGPEWTLDAADAESKWGGVLYDLRRAEQAVTILDEGRARLRRDGQQNTVAFVDLGNTAGLALQHLGRTALARERFEEVLAAKPPPDRDGTDVRPAALTNLATLELMEGNGARAETLLREADGIADAQRVAHPARALKVRLNLAWVLRDLGRHAESRRLFDEVLARGRTFWGTPHGDLSITLAQFATLELIVGNYPEAIVKLDEGIAGETALFGTAHARTRALKALRFVALVANGDDEAARAAADDVFKDKKVTGTAAIATALLECRRTPATRHVAAMRELASGMSSNQRWAKTLVQQWIAECEKVANP
jgi:eukaryotic-like serine/threonine-protein kinase